MSIYKRINTEFKNLDSLCRALYEIGFGPADLEIAVDPKAPDLPLFGYKNDLRPERASIRINRKRVGIAANDLGFAWNGRAFEMIVSEYDLSGNMSQKKIDRLKQAYAAIEVRRQAKARGYSIQEQRLDNGTVRMTLVRR